MAHKERTLLDKFGLWTQKTIWDYYKLKNPSDENETDKTESEKKKYQEYKSSLAFRLVRLKVKDSENIESSCRQYYVKIVCSQSELAVGTEQETSKILALGSPEWNETLTFLVKKEDWENRKELKLECFLFSIDYAMKIKQEGKVDTTMYELQTKKQISFQRNIQVNVDVEVQHDTDVKMRNLFNLCQEEQKFVDKRKHIVMNKMTTKLRLQDLVHADEVPNIAIIGSGGGIRAVIGMCGAMAALQDAGILDSAMYVAGLSGSAWYLLTLYANDKELNTKAVNASIRDNVQNGHTMQLWKAWYSWKYYTKSRSFDTGKYFTITDTFGEMIGALLLGKKCKQKWSEQREKLEHGSVPLPLVAALHVRKESNIKEYHEWIEMSPYEALIPKYGIAIDMRNFGDRFFGGYIIETFEEQPIHFLAGICGSAYAAGKDTNKAGSKWKMFSGMKKWVRSWFNSFDETIIGKVPSWLRGISEVAKATVFECDKVDIKTEEMMLADAGIAFNSPYPTVLNPSRKVDIIISFDFTDRDDDNKRPFKQLAEAEKWANERNIPFPTLNLDGIEPENGTYKEMYVFEDTSKVNAPTILHFVMINDTFRNFGHKDEEGKNFNILPAYSTMKFDYTGQEFDKLKSLMEYNVWNNQQTIIQYIQSAIKTKKTKRCKEIRAHQAMQCRFGKPVADGLIKIAKDAADETILP